MMDKKKVKKQDDTGIRSLEVKRKTGEPFIFPCKLNVVKKKEDNRKINEDR